MTEDIRVCKSCNKFRFMCKCALQEIIDFKLPRNGEVLLYDPLCFHLDGITKPFKIPSFMLKPSLPQMKTIYE